jgi:Parvovirus non-structural protein NS1
MNDGDNTSDNGFDNSSAAPGDSTPSSGIRTPELRISNEISKLHRQQQTSTSRPSGSSVQNLAPVFAEMAAEPRSYWDIRAERAYRVSRNSSDVYLSDVLHCASQEQAYRVARSLSDLSRLSYKGRLLLISVHDQHVHVVHTCSFSNQSCRCRWFQNVEIQLGVRRGIRRRRVRAYAINLSVSDWQNIFRYFTTQGRSAFSTSIGGQVETIQASNATLEISGLEECGSEGSLVNGEEDTYDELRRAGYEDHEEPTGFRRGNKTVTLKCRSKETRTQIKVVDLCKSHCVYPLEAITYTLEWLRDDDLQFLSDKSPLVQAAILNWKKQLSLWSITDFKELYDKPTCNPRFRALTNKDTYFLNKEDTLQVVEDLLTHQFNDDVEAKENFIDILYNVLESTGPKLNTVILIGPQSCGKSYFVDWIIQYFLNAAFLNIVDPKYVFKYQDLLNRRIVHWNEPNYHPDQIDFLKTVLGGEQGKISVKFCDEMPIFRMPFLITTNNPISVMHDPVFADRLRYYVWRPAPFLLEIKKYPNPLYVWDFFVNHGLIVDFDSLIK